METIPVERGDIALEDLARRVEAGERVVLTRGGFDPATGRRFLAEQGIERVVEYIADDFDDPLPEDFLLRPLPDPVPPRT